MSKFSFCHAADFVFVIKCFVLLSDFVLLHFQEPPLFIEGIYQRSVWRIAAELPDPYPYKSPSIGFANKTYHPNVDKMSILQAYLKCSHHNFCYIPIPLIL
ncbi:hypothetical protein DVH24_027391 [Malus domestica]|uniref:UBC core domain-containing protein n=1 Tax=Malus domestica TaxID=3750 RepID=A0A498HDP8_MALDO|nr:hypothetical protein DVH24_027391 [Malus domestica]